jgi:hypothetical protein
LRHRKWPGGAALVARGGISRKYAANTRPKQIGEGPEHSRMAGMTMASMLISGSL